MVDFDSLEVKVVAGLLASQSILTSTIENLDGSHVFTDRKLTAAYECSVKLNEKGIPVDLSSLYLELKKHPEFSNEDDAGIYGWLVKVNEQVDYHPTRNAYFVDSVNNAHRLKMLRQHLSFIKSKAESGDADYSELQAEAEAGLFKLSAEVYKKDEKTLLQQIKETTEQLERAMEQKGLLGLPTGIDSLDRVTGGLQKGNLIIVAGRPGMGKTALALKFTLTSLNYNVPTYFLSREMTDSELIRRLVAMRSTKLDMTPLFIRPMTKTEMNQWHKDIAYVEKMPLVIDDSSATISEVILRAKRAIRNGVRLVVIDYVQLLKGSDKKADPRVQTTEITRELKQLAKSTNVPVVLLSQLSRSVESRGGSKMPQLSDLKESGSIEEDADVVMMLYRPEYYDMETFPDGEDSQGLADIDVAKNRAGRTGLVRVKYIGSKVLFKSRTEEPPEASSLEGAF